MRIRRPRKDSRGDTRGVTRRLADDEAREFVESELEETRDVYRTSCGEFHLEGLCRDAFAAGATTDLRWLKSRGRDAEAFYRDELRPNWEGLDQPARARRIERFIELSHMVGASVDGVEPAPEVRDLIATVHVKVLLLGWAYDRSYGFIDRIFNGPLQYREHRERSAARSQG